MMLARAMFVVAVGSIVLLIAGGLAAVLGSDAVALTLCAAGLIGWFGFLAAVAVDAIRAVGRVDDQDEDEDEDEL